MPWFAHPWNGVSSDYSPLGTFSDLCLKGCSHWHRATCPWPDGADSIDTACHLCLQNGPCALWDLASPCAAPLRHPGLSSILPQLLPGLFPGRGVCPFPGRLRRGTAQLQHSSGTAVTRRERGLLQAWEGFVPGEREDVAVVFLPSCRQSALRNRVKEPVPCPTPGCDSRERWGGVGCRAQLGPMITYSGSSRQLI